MERDDEPTRDNVTRIFRGVAVDPSWPAELEAAQAVPSVIIDGRRFARLRYGSEGRGWCCARGPCHDCAAIKGELHGLHCDCERCPACGGQMISCACGAAYKG
jgi:hypothetical protein